VSSSGTLSILPYVTHPPSLSFSDQFAFQPSASTTAALIHILETTTTLLETNPYAVVLALDFSKAFDSVRHATVLDKFSRLDIPDNIYNWVESFFRDHSHCTRFGDKVSTLKTISASIVQGSAVGPVSYVITASDLQPVSPTNSISKYADDTYLIIPAMNINSCSLELSNIDSWASKNNLQLNRAKSTEIIFVRPRSKGSQYEPPPVISGFTRVQSIKMLGVTFSRKFSVSQHVDELLAACSQSLFALRTLRQHGLPDEALHAVFQAIVINRLSYASPAWWGFASADDRHRLEAFLRRSARLGYRANSSTTFASICGDADDQLFMRITSNSQHLLHRLLPPEREQHYSLRERSHNYQLPERTTLLKDKNYIMRMLYREY